MVRISIYNEKGGVGKTTMTAMLASYLAYAKGKSVCVLDFDYPSYHYLELRRSELSILNDPRSPLSIYMRVSPPAGEPYDIFSIPPGPGGIYRAKEVFDYLPSILSEGYDYVFYDFPGRFTQDEAVSFIAANGYQWLELVPEGGHFALTAMFHDGTLFEQYTDITLRNEVNENGDAAFYDLLLDVVVLSDGTPSVLDREELDEALAGGIISRAEYALALQTADRVVDFYTTLARTAARYHLLLDFHGKREAHDRGTDPQSHSFQEQ